MPIKFLCVSAFSFLNQLLSNIFGIGFHAKKLIFACLTVIIYTVHHIYIYIYIYNIYENESARVLD